MKGVTILVMVTLMFGLELKSQPGRIDSLLVDVLGDEKSMDRLLNPPSLLLYTGISAESKTFYAGREIGEDIYSLNGSVYLFHSGGLYAGATGSWYSQFEPRYSSTVISAGYRKSLDRKKRLTLRASYSRFLFTADDTALININRNLTGLGLTLRNNWIGARVSFNALFGSEFAVNLSPSLFANITLARFGKSGRLFLAPEVSGFIGSETIQYYSAGSALDPLSLTNQTSEFFTLLNTQANLPLDLYIGDFDFEFGYSVNFPISKDTSVKFPVCGFFTFSLGVLLPLN